MAWLGVMQAMIGQSIDMLGQMDVVGQTSPGPDTYMARLSFSCKTSLQAFALCDNCSSR